MKSDEEEVALEQFEEYSKNVDEKDIQNVAKKIGGMNKGALTKVWENIQQLWAMIKDPTAPWGSKAVALGALVYTVSPIDAIPDLIPVAGLTDDAGVILAAVAALGTALSKYSKESNTQTVMIEENAEEEFSKGDFIASVIKYFVSLLSLVAHADGDLSDVEEERSFELIDFFLFSEEGGIVDSEFLEEYKLTKKELKKEIQDIFDDPAPVKEIAEWVRDVYESEESFYFYAYAIANADNNINDDERVFLDYFAELLGLVKYEKNRVERNFNKEWLNRSRRELF